MQGEMPHLLTRRQCAVRDAVHVGRDNPEKLRQSGSWTRSVDKVETVPKFQFPRTLASACNIEYMLSDAQCPGSEPGRLSGDFDPLPSDTTLPLKGSTHTPANRGVFGVVTTRLQTPVWLYLGCVILPIEFFLGTIALTPLRVLLLAMVIPLTVNLFSGRYGKLMAADYLFFAHILWAIVAVAVNNPYRVIENTGSAAVEFLGGYVLARAYIRTPDQFETLVRIMLFLIVISLPFSLAESFSGRAVIPHLIENIPGLTTVKQVDIPKRLGCHLTCTRAD